MVEHLTFNQVVVGSIPTRLTRTVNIHLQRCIDIIETSTAGLSADAAARRPDQRWSVVDVVEHLQRAYSGTVTGLERCLETGEPRARHFSLGNRFWTFVIVGLGYFPRGRQAPTHVLPTGQMDLPEVVARAKHDLARLDEVAMRVRERFGTVKILDHPILGAFTIDQWLRFHAIHTRHHEKQIQALRRGAVEGVR